MQLEELQKHWNAFAKGDPFWAVLTAPDAKNGGWRPDQFFETGKAEIETLMNSTPALNGVPRRRALDFGCGVGRLTQALCDHFVECVGVDISAEMLRVAEVFNRHGGRCTYQLNSKNDLSLFADNYFDFIYSNIVLQHMEPKYSSNYIREFVRVLAPGGLIVFQIPAEIVTRPPAPVETLSQLPDDAFRAAIRVVQSPQTMAPSSEANIIAVVKNVSDVTWPRSCVFLGNHWLTATGAPVQFDDARAMLSRDLAPGDMERVILTATAPADTGSYRMELDLVQEGIAWFKQYGSETADFPVKVAGQKRPPAAIPVEAPVKAPAGAFKARMEMYGMALDMVVNIVTEGGGRFVEIKEDPFAGADWRSYRYTITKDDRSLEPPVRYYFSEYDMPVDSSQSPDTSQ
jgi:SAM-dependent methyltransferase